jgi:hypothetical protein
MSFKRHVVCIVCTALPSPRQVELSKPKTAYMKGSRFLKGNHVFVCLFFLCCSCQMGHELHFFKSGDNYYRLKINESSFSAKAKYVSGMFDEYAVDKYFSEISSTPDSSDKKDPIAFIKQQGDQLQLERNKKLVMILSSNSNSVSEQIGAFAENEQMLESVARLANKDKIEESKRLADIIVASHKRNASVVALGDQFITPLTNVDDVAKVKNSLVLFLQFLKTQNVLTNPNANTSGIDALINNLK